MKDPELTSASDEAAAKQAWPRVVKLSYPIAWGSETIASLTLRRGRAGDMKGIEVGTAVSANALMLIASRMSGQPTQLIELLDIDDVGGVIEIALDFYKAFLAAGNG